MPVKKTTTPKKRAPRAKKAPVFSEEMILEEPVLEEIKNTRDWKAWCMSCGAYVHWVTVGIIVACSFAAIIFGLLLVNPQCSGVMSRFLQPWGVSRSLTQYLPVATSSEVVSVKFMISSDPSDSANVIARVVENDVASGAKFAATGTSPVENAYASGMVKIVNTLPRSFAFVARTRLVTADGVLFRLKLPVNIPANSTIDAEVVADKVGPSGDIGPSTFTFPGLGDGMKEQVYASSSAPMTGGNGVQKSVSEMDLSRAKASLQDKLTKEAGDNFRAMVGAGERLLSDLITSNEKGFTAPKVGTVTDYFDARLDSQYKAMIFMESLVEDKVFGQYMMLHSDAVRANLTMRNPVYVVEAYDVKKGLAEVRVEAEVLP